ncbi:metallophosphoesterase family protein [Streptomyces tendae]|uniref:metallophosphoesterase family protein n=1 Tax=Streptomyces tendae TaxID=1932 RepID=UPI00248FDDED|nr:metallophosphoesterase family protein [Streptomyces tendae]
MAVLSDMHGMSGPLDRVLAEPAVASADLVLVTGDHTWGPEPADVLDRLVGLGDDPLPVRGAGQLRRDRQRLLDRMPEQLTVEVDGFGPVLFCHATPRDDQEVVLVDSRIERWQEVFADVPPSVSTVVCGHTVEQWLDDYVRRPADDVEGAREAACTARLTRVVA